MARLSLLYRTPKKAQIGALILDASISENHERSANLSQSPIEDGSLVTDHVTLNPLKLTLNGIISDVPLSDVGSLIGSGVGTVSSTIGESLGGIAGAAAALGVGSVASLVSESPRDVQDAFKYLNELWKNRTPFTVVTALTRYQDMIITNITFPRSATIGGGLQFNIQLEQVRIVQSSVIKLPVEQLKDDAKRSQGTNKLGKQAAKNAKEETGRKSSLLLQGFKKIGAFS